jgi:hypothetical protein
MSLWFQNQPGTFAPPDSRTIGWSQVPNRKATFAPARPDEDHPQSSTGGGTILDLGSSFNVKGPSSNFNFDVTMNYSNFQFQNVNDVTFNTLNFQETVQQFMTNIQNNILSVISSSAPCDLTQLCQRVADLEAWKATGISTCSEFPVVQEWRYPDSGGDIRVKYGEFTITDGLLVYVNGSQDISGACGGTVPSSVYPVNACPP